MQAEKLAFANMKNIYKIIMYVILRRIYDE